MLTSTALNAAPTRRIALNTTPGCLPRPLATAIIGFAVLLGLLQPPCSYAAPVTTDTRVALVIGNSKYEAGALQNPGNDARAISAKLKELGFDVTMAEDVADDSSFLRLEQEFRRKIAPGSIALFYYSGHAVEVNGENYLIPVRNQAIRSLEDVEVDGFSAQLIIKRMEDRGGKLNVVVLDACRDNPLPATSRSATRGLGRMEAQRGTVVAFATSEGRTAADGDGVNSPYTKALLNRLGQPGLTVNEMFNAVGNDVAAATDNVQIPWLSSSPVPSVKLAGELPPPEPPLPPVGGSFADRLADGKEGPALAVVADNLAVGAYEVTVGEFRHFRQSGAVEGKGETSCFAWDADVQDWSMQSGLRWDNPGHTQSERHPVVCVAWEEAQAYVEWLSAQTGKRYRLLTERDWQALATRARGALADPCKGGNFADETLSPDGQATFGDGTGCRDGHWDAAPVGSFPDAGTGVHDLYGNVWEWTADCSNSRGQQPCDVHRAVGGSWMDTAVDLADRQALDLLAINRFDTVGFRVAREVDR